MAENITQNRPKWSNSPRVQPAAAVNHASIASKARRQCRPIKFNKPELIQRPQAVAHKRLLPLVYIHVLPIVFKLDKFRTWQYDPH